MPGFDLAASEAAAADIFAQAVNAA